MPRISIDKLLQRAYKDGFIVCPKCGRTIKADVEHCPFCNWKNVLVKGCWI